MAIFYVVTGAPCSGKTTFVEQNRNADDLVLDLDALQRALGSKRNDFHSLNRLKFALACRDACLDVWKATRITPAATWYISCWPSPAEEATFPKSAIKQRMFTSQEECLRRARESGRSPQTAGLIKRWFRDHGRTIVRPSPETGDVMVSAP